MYSEFTTTHLQHRVATGGPGLHPRICAPLLRLDTPQRRERALAEAQTRVNIAGGRLSDRTHEAVNALLDLIARDREDQPLHGEATARFNRDNQRHDEDQRIAREIATLA